MTILVAYGEIALKSRRVRGGLERLLARQIEERLRRGGFPSARALRRFGRIYVEGVTADAAHTIADVFGVVSAMPAVRTGSELNSIIELAVDVTTNKMGDGQSFAVRPNVVGEHPYSSRELAVKVGSAVLGATGGKGIHVDLSQPDVTLYLEVRDRDAFAYTEIVRGVGGLPYASQGKLVSLFSGGIDSPVAAWLMMRRGVEVLPLLMDQRPHVGESYIDRALSACRAIAEHVPSGELGLHVAPMGEIMSRIMESPEPRLRCVLCKRSMYRIASALAAENDARGIVTGESLGQVASQTLDNLYVLDNAVEVPVIRPIIGMDKVEIEELARRIGTYEITARAVDGCTVVPDRVTTRASLDKVLELEEALGLADLCSRAAEKITTV